MAVTVQNKKGDFVKLLNPSEKARKFADELATGMRYTNDNRLKADKNGDVGLSKTQRAYRSGYLDARKDNAKAYKHNKKKKAANRKKKA